MSFNLRHILGAGTGLVGAVLQRPYLYGVLGAAIASDSFSSGVSQAVSTLATGDVAKAATEFFKGADFLSGGADPLVGGAFVLGAIALFHFGDAPFRRRSAPGPRTGQQQDELFKLQVEDYMFGNHPGGGHRRRNPFYGGCSPF